MSFIRHALLLLIVILCPLRAAAHELDPGYLELAALGEDRWRVTWRTPDVAGTPMPISVSLPLACAPREGPAPKFDGKGWSTTWVVACEGGLAGETIRIDGLERTSTDTLVRYEIEPGTVEVRRLTATEPAFTVDVVPGGVGIFTSYLEFGVVHILEGIDHLVFVFALLLLTGGTRKLFWAVTAFTLAHSITLAGSTFGWIALPSAPVEVVIALSIVFLAYEISLPSQRRDALTERFPGFVAFGFGLIHGLGFAGALREIGIPQGDVPLALLAFNLGVETGQLIFIATLLVAWFMIRRIFPGILAHLGRMTAIASYAIGTTSAYWVVDRLSGF
ncbi:HupE/UreJ family protein [Sinirhodobacter sp. HNIBRBA609]|nr:HupE/UreJ family protein [Sinirhodobacter sp. HNIBRBA609]